MSKIEQLFSDKWLSVNKKTMDNGSEYIYSNSPWCKSNGIAILPFRKAKDGYPEFLGRFEICPAHSDEIELCSITGGMDKEGESPALTAVRELIEEGGYKVPLENVISLGTVRPSKSSDSTNHLFAVNLDNGAEEVEAVGDGTLGEEGAYCSWISLEELVDAKDPLLHSIFLRALENGEVNYNI